jgi:transcriptional regulator with XRE-family HTH domain
MQNQRSEARAAKIFGPAGARDRVHAHTATLNNCSVPAEFSATRQLCGLTLAELALRATVSISQLSEFENGLAQLTRERLAAVSHALRLAMRLHAKLVAEAVQQKRPRAPQNTAIRAQNRGRNCEPSPHAGGTVIPLEMTKRGRI